ncbi:uncharacterized protein BKA78DRAFT_351924 [Phyllosticta capitalensis]|uniref:uncharacterized protein n=1 Tax=Phyllosticta capitalensis TaxID=121624 RepID=UPI00312CFF14
MSNTDDLDLVAALLTNLRNAKATFGENSPQYKELKAMVDEHIANAAIAPSEPTSAQQQQHQESPSASNQHQQPQFFNLAFRPRVRGEGPGQ